MIAVLHRLNRRTVWLIVTALCSLHIWMAASVSRTFSTTADEMVHLTAGYAYWKTGDYRLQPENGLLPQKWAALPLLFQNLKFPPVPGSVWAESNAWNVGDLFFHRLGNDLPTMLAAGRWMVALLSGVLCIVIFVTARGLFGINGGFIALILAVFCPHLLAHGGLATSDTAAALGFMVAVFAWWRLLQQVTVSRWLLAGAALGGLALSKYSVVLMVPIAGALALVRLGRPSPLPASFGRRHWQLRGFAKMAALPGLLVGTGLLAAGIIWAAYGFRYSSAASGNPADSHFVQSWDTVLFNQAPSPPMKMADGQALEATDARPGLIQHAVSWSRGHRLLPEAYLYGLAFVEKNSRGRLAFFAGEYRMTGWRLFFPVAFLVKTTLPALALMVLGLAGIFSLRHQPGRVELYRLAPLFALLIVYWIFAVTSRLNIGHRHLLPVYPAFYILAGGIGLLTTRSWRWIAAAGALLIWHGRESIWIRPDYLAYFNPSIGGPTAAYHWFVDSSLDWGQDLPRLSQWLDQQAPHERIFISYFGSGSPEHEGIQATRFGDAYFDGLPRRTPAPLSGGVYCISATMFERVYTHVRGPWSLSYEQAYENLAEWLVHVQGRPRGQPPTDLDGSPLTQAAIESRLTDYEQLQFGRLCYFLKDRKIDARIGFSILVFRLSDAEIVTALHAPLESFKSRAR